jgi:hypothetical protein
MVGINAIMSYGGEVASKVLPSLKLVMPALLMLLFFICSIISIKFVTNHGRKPLTFYGTIGIVISLLTVTYGYFIYESNIGLAQTVLIIGLFAYLIIYGLTYAPVMWIFVA